jgi:hypothetical protein
MGVEYELTPGSSRLSKRDEMTEHTGQRLYPATEFADGTWYREESRDMEATIRACELMERVGGTRSSQDIEQVSPETPLRAPDPPYRDPAVEALDDLAWSFIATVISIIEETPSP